VDGPDGHGLWTRGRFAAEAIGLRLANLATASLAGIVDGERYRAVRRSILDGRPIVNCRGCSMAQRQSFAEFVRGIREWQGDPTAWQNDSRVDRGAWPGPFSAAEYPVILENRALRVGERGAATLIEDTHNGLHRCLFDLETPTTAELALLAKPVRSQAVAARSGTWGRDGGAHAGAPVEPVADRGADRQPRLPGDNPGPTAAFGYRRPCATPRHTRTSICP